jgi:predicted PurR-regulated permease PerM
VFRFGRALLVKTVNVVFKFFLVLMIAAFILLDLEKLHALARGLIPQQHRDDYGAVIAAVDRGLSGVIRGQILICLLNGALTYIGMLIFGVKYALVLGLLATLLSLIPIFGTILSTIPIVLAALVSGQDGVDVMRGVFILAWILGIHFLEANLFNPRIMGTTARIHPVLVVFALLAGEHAGGLVGALLAVPVASVIQALFVFFRQRAWRAPSAG